MKLKYLALPWLVTMAGLLASATISAQDNLRQTLFEEAQDALIAANKAQAAVLAPTGYAAGAGHYKRAEELLERRGNIDRIRSELAKAVAEWKQATEATDVARLTLSNAIQAREDAMSADAENYSPDEWKEGEQYFNEAATRLESGSLRSAEREAGRAETVYREAELAAIKANYLNETQSLLNRADKLKAERYAPATFARAQSLYAEAEKELTENRYDTDRPRSLAQDAKHEANVAIYLAENLARVDRRRAELEEFVVDWQTPLKRIGATLDMPVYFDAGYEEATAQLVAKIDELLSTNRAQSQDLNERKERIREMERQIAGLEFRLGGASQERLALAAQLDQQARIKARFAAVEQMFDRDEAIVIRTGNDIILRLVGLTFASGKSEISSDRFALLRKVEQAINQFPGSIIGVEGHTDSFGSDATNLKLSSARAESVKAYMLASMGLDVTQVVATGYGETRPIANNETNEGRAKNRRIDIVISPDS